jgi:aminoglycoside phosphotransferase (APT) family kinase protein
MEGGGGTSEDLTKELGRRLPELLGAEVELSEPKLLAGGASKQAWAVDAVGADGTLELLVRRATGGAIFTGMLSLQQEYQVLRAAFDAGVKVPRPYGYLPALAGRDAFVMERVKGETIGRRIVRRPEFAAPRAALPLQMAEQLARIHSVPLEQVDFVPGPRTPPVAEVFLNSLQDQLDTLLEPHPAIELGLRWLRDHAPPHEESTFIHADFRLGNLVVDEDGLVAVLDWEMAQAGPPVADLAWPLVRAWRFGADDKRLAGLSGAEPYLERYNELTGRAVTLGELFYWEVAGNVRWAIGSLAQGMRHVSGEERSVELAVLGRLAAEVEYELLHLLAEAG